MSRAVITSSSTSCSYRATCSEPSRVRVNVRRAIALVVLLNRRPETVRVQTGDVGLALLARTAGDDGLALVVDLVREPARLRARISEQLLEHEDHVGERVDRVVPNDHDPRHVGARVLTAEQLLDRVGDGDLLDVRRGHHSSGRTSSAIRASNPFTKRPESLVEYCFASSTASVMIAPVGVSGTQASSYVPSRSNARSTTGMRSSDQCSEYLRTSASIASRCSSAPSTIRHAYSSGSTGCSASSSGAVIPRNSHS